MVYGLPLEEITKTGIMIKAQIDSDLRKNTKANPEMVNELEYYSNCYILKQNNFPAETPGIKTAEKLYSKGKVKKANEVLTPLVLDAFKYTGIDATVTKEFLEKMGFTIN